MDGSSTASHHPGDLHGPPRQDEEGRLMGGVVTIADKHAGPPVEPSQKLEVQL